MSSLLLCCEPVENGARSTLQTWGLSDWRSLDIAQISITTGAFHKTFQHRNEQVGPVLEQMMVVQLLS